MEEGASPPFFVIEYGRIEDGLFVRDARRKGPFPIFAEKICRKESATQVEL